MKKTHPLWVSCGETDLMVEAESENEAAYIATKAMYKFLDKGTKELKSKRARCIPFVTTINGKPYNAHPIAEKIRKEAYTSNIQ